METMIFAQILDLQNNPTVYWLGSLVVLVLAGWYFLRQKTPNFERLTMIVALTLLAGGVSLYSKYRVGPDLKGGTILIYKITEDEGGSVLKMDELIAALKRRLDPSGLQNYVIRPLGSDQVEIIMPDAVSGDVDLVKRRISTVGDLQFRIVAQRKRHGAFMEMAEQQWPENKKVVGTGPEGETVLATFVPYGIWLPIVDNEQNAEFVAKARAMWKELANRPNRKVADNLFFVNTAELENFTRSKDGKYVMEQVDGQDYVLARWDDDGNGFTSDQMGADGKVLQRGEHLVRTAPNGMRYVLLFEDQYNVTGKYLTRVSPTVDTRTGSPAVEFNFNTEGASKFYELTGEYKPETDKTVYRLAVVLDGKLRSAPQLNARIGASGIITLGTNSTNEEATALSKILQAGKLPHAVSKLPSSEFRISATLGQETINAGLFSVVLSLVAVIAVMVVYYKTGGMIAVFGLTLNLLFTVALMVMCKATWTLPGLAGLVLTVGMAVDANVLIYERLREELTKGASLAMAVRAGYEKAFSTILDSNLTTIITAMFLYLIGTDQIKGYAISLMMGLGTSLFCALTVCRTVTDFIVAKRWIRSLPMRQLFGKTNIDFLRYERKALTVSAVLAIAGLVALFLRGGANFDVDFTGGTMAGLQFKQPLTSPEVRERALAAGLPEVAVEEQQLGGQPSGTHFIVRTTEKDEGKEVGEALVRDKLVKAFGNDLVLPSIAVGKITAIAAAPAAKTTPEAKTATEAKTTPEAKTSDDGGQNNAAEPFAGGSSVTFRFANRPRAVSFVQEKINDVLRAKNPASDPTALYSLQSLGEGMSLPGERELAFQEFKLASNLDVKVLTADLQDMLAKSPDFDQFNQFGPQVAGETRLRALWALALSWVGIIIYVWFRFGSWSFGLAGVIALVHDSIIALGLLAMVSALGNAVPVLNALYIVDMKINLNVVAAVLTLIGYSINDTIVVFDRIREIRARSPHMSTELVNRAINETLSRTIITSGLTFLTVIILFLGGGPDLRGFGFILAAGIIVGTYSSIFIAAPLLLVFHEWQEKRSGQVKLSKQGSAAAAAL